MDDKPKATVKTPASQQPSAIKPVKPEQVASKPVEDVKSAESKRTDQSLRKESTERLTFQSRSVANNSATQKNQGPP